jgi:hypothetical protein
MIAYKVDLPTQLDANGKIKDMQPVLAEIATSLRILQDTLTQHQESFSTPSVDQYREDLARMVAEANRLAHLIHANSQRLAQVSVQASKQLVDYDVQIKNALMAKENVAASTVSEPVIGVNNPGTRTEKTNIFSGVKF